MPNPWIAFVQKNRGSGKNIKALSKEYRKLYPDCCTYITTARNRRKPLSRTSSTNSPKSRGPYRTPPTPKEEKRASLPILGAPTRRKAADGAVDELAELMEATMKHTSKTRMPKASTLKALAAPPSPPASPPSHSPTPTAPTPDLRESKALYNYHTLVNIYDLDCRPPEWALRDSAQILKTYGKESFVLYTGGSLKDVRRLATEREPVNIAMTRSYDLQALQREFGYSKGAYAPLSENGTKLPPQIAVACVTPVRFKGQTRTVAVVNLIGMAFDNAKQPDYRVLIKNGKLDKERLFQLMVNAYKMAFKAAEIMKRSTLCCSPIGDVAFRPKKFYNTPQKFVDQVIKPAVEMAGESFPKIKTMWAQYPDFNVPSAFFGLPPSTTSKWTEELDDRLFVNAWDCWSMLGNGNSADDSADGFWGRSSAIALLGWPKSNPHIEYVKL